MDLRQLSYLVAVRDAGGVRAAARRLTISQPPISQALRALELELGTALVRRTPQGIEFTAAGDELVDHARQILADVVEARAAVKRAAGGRSTTLRIGLVSGVVSAGELLAPILDTYREQRPSVTLRLEELSFADQVTPLLADLLDVVIARGPIDHGPLAHRQLEVVPIAHEPRLLLVGKDHEIAELDHVDVEDVLDMPTLALASPDDWSDFWQLNDIRGGANTATHVAAAGTVPEVQLAVATQGVVVSTPGAVARLQPHPLVRTVPLDGAAPAVIAVAKRRRDHRAVVRQFVMAAQTAALEKIGMLPGGTLPD